MEGGSAITGCTYAANVLTCPTITATTQLITGTFLIQPYAGGVNFGANGNYPVSIFADNLRLRASASIGFDPGSTAYGGTLDLKLTRYAAKQLMISGDGTGATTNAGLIVGYCGTSGFGCTYATTVTPGTNNYALAAGSALTILNAPASGTVQIGQNGVAKANFVDGAGRGMDITAGTTATNANRALSISQTWTDGTSSNIGIVGNFDMGATGTATGKLLSLQAGAAGTTEVFYTAQTGQVGATQYSALSAVSGTVLLGSTVSTSAFMGVRDGGVTTVRNVGAYGWVSNDNAGSGTVDTYISRPAAGIISFDTGTAGNGLATLALKERTAPSAPAADGAYIYAVDNGGGKTQLCALFSSGAAQCFATEP